MKMYLTTILLCVTILLIAFGIHTNNLFVYVLEDSLQEFITQ